MIKKVFLFSLLSFSVLLMAACSSTPKTDAHAHDDALENFNRAMFEFNYRLDRHFLKPVAQAYRAVTTPDIRARISSALSNLKEPMSAANHLLQGEFKQSGVAVGRFVINSTLGLAGTFDVATAWGLEKDHDNFEETLAKWCIKDGPYIVLPFLGSSTPRSLVGTFVDSFTSPVYWLTEEHEDGIYAYGAYVSVKMVVAREAALDLGDDLERNSVDFYTTMKSAYLQNKTQMPNCYNDSSSTAYDFDFDIENEDEIFDEMEAQ